MAAMRDASGRFIKGVKQPWGKPFEKGHKKHAGAATFEVGHEGYKPWKGKFGEEHSCWKGGTTPEEVLARQQVEYRRWRRQVLIRDEFTCQDCGAVEVVLECHHIKRFKDYPELRHDIENGKTLCQKCHGKYRRKVNHG